MQALEVAHSISKQFVVEIEKQFHSCSLLLHRFSENFLAYQESVILWNQYLFEADNRRFSQISAKFSLDSIFVEKYGPLTALIS